MSINENLTRSVNDFGKYLILSIRYTIQTNLYELYCICMFIYMKMNTIQHCIAIDFTSLYIEQLTNPIITQYIYL